MIFGANKKANFTGGGLILFDSIEEVLKAERILKKASYETKLVAPPPAIRKGCDLALEINLFEKVGIERLLQQNKMENAVIIPAKGYGELLGVVKITDFGEALMVKAGNMKLTFNKNSGIILNVSGGGCPDIPYLHGELIDKKLTDVPRPKEKGFTLCSIMLDRAYVESIELWENLKRE